MNKVNGILMLLIYVCLVTALMPGEGSDFLKEENIANLARRIALFGIIGVGVAFVIITGGIDLSIGSMIGLMGCTLAILLQVEYVSWDRALITNVDPESSVLEVSPDRRMELSPGDRIAVYDGKVANQGLYTIEEVRRTPTESNAEDGKRFEITTKEALKTKDSNGKVERLLPIENVDLEFFDILVKEKPERLTARDQILYFAPDFKKAESIEVRSVFQSDGVWHVELESLPDQLTKDGYFAVVDRQALPIPLAIGFVLVLSVLIGAIHGLLITKLSLQPFVVTLCGLLVYRGIARTLTNDQTVGFGVEYDESIRAVSTSLPVSVPVLLLLAGIVALVVSLGWLLYRFFRTPSEERQQGNAILLAGQGVLFGLILIVIGSSRFWYGFDAISDASLFVRFFSSDTIVSPRGLDMPSQLMGMLGLLFIPCGLGFVATGIVRDPFWGSMAFGLLVLSTVGLFIGKFVSVWLGEAFGFESLSASRLNLVGLLFAVGQFFICLGCVIRVVLKANPEWGKVFLVATTGFVLIWLAGQSELGKTLVPAPFFVLLVVAFMAAVFLNLTVYGRYMLALGRNEQAARFSGIRTDRMTILAYVICSFCAGLGGILFALDLNSIQPATHGNFYEVYAIAAAVLGGCSLRGGEGSVLGVMIGAAVMQTLRNSISLLDAIPEKLEFAIIGFVILIGAIADEVARRLIKQRRATREENQLESESKESA